ncbi:coiled-coil domain-containing protein 12 [Amblyomma americanum]|uniref:Cwf18 pre-mrna splicing factor n=1 Tax=Amblyomma americanum TaxID=6943 RepID=A0AAQ4EXC4_AMBAM
MAADELVGSLEEQALKRKERLRALREKKAGANDAGTGEDKASSHESLPKPVFRSYRPEDDALKESVLPDASPAAIEEEIKHKIAVGDPEDLAKEVDLASLAPRKPDWDLKRDVSKKLEKLERRTKRAIAELIRERLGSTAAGGDDLASVVNAASGPQNIDSDDD